MPAKAPSTLEISHPQPRTVHGIAVRKMPLGAYVAFLQRGGRLLPALLGKLFPDMSGAELVTRVAAQRGKALYDLLGWLLAEAPDAALEAVAELLGVPPDALLGNPAIGPAELLDVLEAWNEINDLTGFFARVSKRFPRP